MSRQSRSPAQTDEGSLRLGVQVRVKRLIASSSARLAMLYAALFALSSTLLLGTVYWASAGYLSSQTNAGIDTEIELLAERYRSSSLRDLVRLIDQRISRGSALVYVLADPLGRRIAGNLVRWPDAATVQRGRKDWFEFELHDPEAGAKHSSPARAKVFTLRGGFHLLVGRDIRELEAVQDAMLRAMGWGLLVTVALSLLGAMVMARGTSAKIEAINSTCRDIMAGNLHRRVPEDGSGDDFDQLSAGLNQMLARIQELMNDVRATSDNIAHDLRTPLTRLRNRLENIAKQYTSTQLRADAQAAVDEAESLLATFSALLRIAQVEHGARDAASAGSDSPRVDLPQLAQDAFELYEPMAEDAGISLHLDLGGTGDIKRATPVWVGADRDLLFQALANLLDNALKFTPRGGQVNLSLYGAPEGLQLVVEDNGPGIPAQSRAHVFKRFYRAETSRYRPGNGLGLSLVAAVAQRYGIHIELEDRAPGLAVRLAFPGETTTTPNTRSPAPAAEAAQAGPAIAVPQS